MPAVVPANPSEYGRAEEIDLLRCVAIPSARGLIEGNYMAGKERQFAPGTQCALCRVVLIGQFSIAPFWNVPFCRTHEICECCCFPTTAAVTGQRPYCSRCRPTLVQDKSVGLLRLVDVARRLGRGISSDGRGMIIPLADIRFTLNGVLRKNRLGYTQMQGQTLNGKLVARTITVNVKSALPEIEFDMVAAHELTHAWFYLNSIQESKKVTEGIAELNAYWLLSKLQSPVAEILMKKVSTNPDRVYGDGFREAYHRERKLGWGEISNQLLKSNRS